MASFPWWYGPRWPLRYLLPSLGGGEAFRKPLRWEHREEEGSAKCHGKSVSLLFFGDFMPMGQAPAYVSPVIQQLFRDADFVVGNLETAILDEMNWFQRIASKLFHCMSCVDFEAWMKELHVTPSKMFLSFANNHSFDWGDKGFRMTVQILRDMGITVLGVEHVPEIAQISNRIGVVSWTHWLNFQGDDEAVTTFDSVTSINWSTLKEQAGMHTLIGCPHWDYEFNFYPDKSTYMTATTLLDRGFDVLVGTHSHTPQPVVLFPSAQDSDSPSLLKQQEKSKAEKDTKTARIPAERSHVSNKKLIAFSLGDFNGFPLPAFLQRRDHTVGELLEIQLDEATGNIISYRVHWVEWVPTIRHLLSTRHPVSAFAQ